MRAQQDIPAEIEAVLGVERGMVLWKIQRVEVVALRLGFGAGHAREAELTEDVADLVHHLGDEMQPATPLAAARHREIDAGQSRRALLETGLARVDRALELALQRVGGAAD